MSIESIPHSLYGYRRGFAFFIATLYVLLVGFGTCPHGLEVTVLLMLLLGSLMLLQNERERPNHVDLLLFGLGMLSSLSFAIYTNHLVLALNRFALFFVCTYFLVGLAECCRPPASASQYIIGLLRYLGALVLTLLSPSIIASFVRREGREHDAHVPVSHVRALILSVPILIFFHFLFSIINNDYATFMADIVRYLWDFLVYLFEDLIYRLLEIALCAYVLYGMYSVLLTPRPQSIEEASFRDSIQIVIGLTVLLFLIFAFFQSKLLFIQADLLPFKELSLYTQKGFWELLIVACSGYILLLYSTAERPTIGPEERWWRALLHIFVAELLLITVFTYHKLYLLQLYFGLKDQRIFAVCGVLLIALTFILAPLRIIGRMSSERIFMLQIYAFSAVTVILTCINVDLTVTRLSPIRYYADGRAYKDLSYLLGNSFDNSSEWLALMDEGERVDIPQAENYYWGDYEPICRKNSETRNSDTYLRSRYAKLIDAYKLAAPGTSAGIKGALRFNFHEAAAYRVVRENETRIGKFLDFAASRCTFWKNPPLEPPPIYGF